MKKINILLLIILSLFLFSCNCHNENNDDNQDTPNYKVEKFSYYQYLDTISSIIIEYDTNKISADDMKTKMKQIDNILYDVELLFSPEATVTMIMRNATSLLMEVNSNAGKVDESGNLIKTEITDEFIEVLETSIEIAESLNGYFDPTVGKLTTLWDIPNQVGKSNPKIPSDEEISEAISGVGIDKIILDKENKTISLPSNTHLDFGAIAKGYACDKVLDYLKTLDITICLIDLGGNIYSYGESQSIKTNTGIRNPFATGSSDYTLFTSNINNVSVVTSGIYERYITVNGVNYHHLLDPKSGYPSDNEIESVSIIGTSSMKCDAIATGIYGLGLTDGINKIKTMEDYDAVFITKDKKVYIVGNIDYDINPYIDENFEFIKVE